MKRYARLAAVVGLVVAAFGGATYAFLVLSDPPQRAAARPRPPSAPPVGHATPRSGTPSRGAAPPLGQAVPRSVPPQGAGPIVRGRFARPYVYSGVDLGFWYDWPYPYGYAAYGYPPYAYPWPTYPLAVSETATGSVRFDVSPTDAEVYVDGYYAGIVDDFNGILHHLTLTAGPHMIEVCKTGFETLTVAIFVQPHETVTYRAAMSPVPSGATSPPQPPSLGEGIRPGTASHAPAAGAPQSGASGDLLFDVTPKEAEVYVDGYYVGIVDDFSGRHHLNLSPGEHHVQLRIQGFKSAEVDVMIQSHHTTTYRDALVRTPPVF